MLNDFLPSLRPPLSARWASIPLWTIRMSLPYSHIAFLISTVHHFQVRHYLHWCSPFCSVSWTTRSVTFPPDFTCSLTGYTGVIHRNIPISFRSSTACKVSCSQVFYYFQRYGRNDGPGTKAVVRLGKLWSVRPILTASRSSPPWYPTRFIRRSYATWVRSALISIPATSRSKYRIPVYIYVITGYNTPQRLGNLVWYAPPASVMPFTHLRLTLQEPLGMSLLASSVSPHSLCASRLR